MNRTDEETTMLKAQLDRLAGELERMNAEADARIEFRRKMGWLPEQPLRTPLRALPTQTVAKRASGSS